MWQHIYYTSSNIFTTRPFESNIFASPALDVYPFLSLLQAQTTLINFTVTRTGLEDQILAEIVKADRPDLESQKSELTRQLNEYKILLKSLEDNLLQKLNTAGDDIINDIDLINNLEHTKKTAAEVEVKVHDAKVTSKEIDLAREKYRSAAARASVLYFILNDLNRINPMYQVISTTKLTSNSLKLNQFHIFFSFL